MFICQFFNGNPNFQAVRATKAISRIEVNLENSNPMDLDIKGNLEGPGYNENGNPRH